MAYYIHKKFDWVVSAEPQDDDFTLDTGRALFRGKAGDYIVRNANGEATVLAKDLFQEMYELITDKQAKYITGASEMPYIDEIGVLKIHT